MKDAALQIVSALLFISCGALSEEGKFGPAFLGFVIATALILVREFAK